MAIDVLRLNDPGARGARRQLVDAVGCDALVEPDRELRALGRGVALGVPVADLGPLGVDLLDAELNRVIEARRRPHGVERVDAGVDLALDGADLVAAHDGAEAVRRVDGLPHEVLGGGVSPEEADVRVRRVAVLVPAGGNLRVGSVGDDDVSLLGEPGGEQLFLGVEGIAHDVVGDGHVVPGPQRPPAVGAVGEGPVGVSACGGKHVGYEAGALHACGREAGPVGVGPAARAAE